MASPNSWGELDFVQGIRRIIRIWNTVLGAFRDYSNMRDGWILILDPTYASDSVVPGDPALCVIGLNPTRLRSSRFVVQVVSCMVFLGCQ